MRRIFIFFCRSSAARPADRIKEYLINGQNEEKIEDEKTVLLWPESGR